MNDFDKFLLWEAKSRDTIDFKKIYVDIVGDLVTGLLLSQIIYWYLPNEHGQTKLRVNKEGFLWIAKAREDWWDEIRISAKQFDRACSILIKKGILAKNYFMFGGFRTMHIRLNQEQFMALWEKQIHQGGRPVFPKGQDRSSPKGKTGLPQRARPITETTPETTPDILENSQNPKPQYTDIERQTLNRLGKTIAHSGNIGHVQTTDELRTITLIGADIAQITKTDILTVDLGELRALASLTIRLSNNKGDIAAKLKLFKLWWYNEYWLGKDKSQPPTIKQFGSTWGQFEASHITQTNGATNAGPVLTETEKKRLAELIAENGCQE